MRIDAALLEHAADGALRPPILRIYGWPERALSLGAHQRVSTDVAARCEQFAVAVVRRPTGGSAVLHGRDLTYAVVAPHDGRSVLECYRWVAAGLLGGLAELGLQARVSADPGGRAAASGRLDPEVACFTSTLGADIQVAGSKICGSAQLRRRGWFLQHGSIPIEDDRSLTRRILQHPAVNRSTWVRAHCPGSTFEDVAACLVRGFTGVWGAYRTCHLGELLPASGKGLDPAEYLTLA